ncbi:MAG: SDR family oxidoreductase, partial [Myxococcota bacterium]
FDQTFGLNIRGPYYLLRKLSESFRSGSSVVFNTTIANRKGFPNTAIYAASKGALRSLARVLAAEWAPRGIRVNCVAPGPIDTPIFGKVGLPEDMVGEARAGFAGQVPLGRLGTSEEVARVVAFLLSEQASFVNGTEIDVDGGLVAM